MFFRTTHTHTHTLPNSGEGGKKKAEAFVDIRGHQNVSFSQVDTLSCWISVDNEYWNNTAGNSSAPLHSKSLLLIYVYYICAVTDVPQKGENIGQLNLLQTECLLCERTILHRWPGQINKWTKKKKKQGHFSHFKYINKYTQSSRLFIGSIQRNDWVKENLRLKILLMDESSILEGPWLTAEFSSYGAT